MVRVIIAAVTALAIVAALAWAGGMDTAADRDESTLSGLRAERGL